MGPGRVKGQGGSRRGGRGAEQAQGGCQGHGDGRRLSHGGRSGGWAGRSASPSSPGCLPLCEGGVEEEMGRDVSACIECGLYVACVCACTWMEESSWTRTRGQVTTWPRARPLWRDPKSQRGPCGCVGRRREEGAAHVASLHALPTHTKRREEKDAGATQPRKPSHSIELTHTHTHKPFVLPFPQALCSPAFPCRFTLKFESKPFFPPLLDLLLPLSSNKVGMNTQGFLIFGGGWSLLGMVMVVNLSISLW